MSTYLGAIDQGTTSTRFIIFDSTGRIVSVAQKEHEQIYPKPGWVEHDPEEIWRRIHEVMTEAMQQRGIRPKDVAALGITNQRETTIVWNRKTGVAVYNAIVWQDTRVEDYVAEFAREGPLLGPLYEIGRDVFPERGKALRHVADGAGKIFDLGQPRRMALDLIEVEALDMPDLAHHLDQRGGDQALREPCRQQPGEDDQHRQADQ